MFKAPKLWLLTVFLLAGCPGQGDRLTPSETTTVKLSAQNVCFSVPHAEHYQPSIIIIAPRNTLPKERWYRNKPALNVKDGLLCLPPSFYAFKKQTPYIVEYALIPTRDTGSVASRHVVVGFELTNDTVRPLRLNDSEISQ
ncbi:putative T6SS immunity periplasmic lipoprotein [Cronobacter turicensis]|uniref:putative T6SS immunity periplasmic lipoprotein n=1 Tax=Kosakonia cowanii TaxID=208223 RepID=UPI0028A143A0|nr:putative T6SS immunity periplasmic lipoprotein [Kosakonia cowanii]